MENRNNTLFKGKERLSAELSELLTKNTHPDERLARAYHDGINYESLRSAIYGRRPVQEEQIPSLRELLAVALRKNATEIRRRQRLQAMFSTTQNQAA